MEIRLLQDADPLTHVAEVPVYRPNHARRPGRETGQGTPEWSIWSAMGVEGLKAVTEGPTNADSDDPQRRPANAGI